MKNQSMEQTSTMHLSILMVSRRVRRREGARSTQRPRAEEKRRTQMVSATPLWILVWECMILLYWEGIVT